MKRVVELADDQASMTTLVDLTGIFEGIASMRIAQIKDQVLQSSKFYKQLWSIYSQIRVGNEFSFGRETSDKNLINKELMIVITAEGSFSGDIDQKLVKLVLQDYSKDKNDIIVIGHHGAVQLAQNQAVYKKYFKMPTQDRDINVTPIVHEIKNYRTTKVYYQEYVSLMVQDVRRIELSSAVNERGEIVTEGSDLINEKTYIFEPSAYAVAAHLERSMMQIAISQLILESKLAQYASRFQAMSSANSRANEILGDVHTEFNRARRAVKDDRLKEIVNGLKKASLGTTV